MFLLWRGDARHEADKLALLHILHKTKRSQYQYKITKFAQVARLAIKALIVIPAWPTCFIDDRISHCCRWQQQVASSTLHRSCLDHDVDVIHPPNNTALC